MSGLDSSAVFTKDHGIVGWRPAVFGEGARCAYKGTTFEARGPVGGSTPPDEDADHWRRLDDDPATATRSGSGGKVQRWFDLIDRFITAKDADEDAVNALVNHDSWRFGAILTWLRSMNSKNAERNQRIAALEQRLAAVEEREKALGPPMTYHDVWDRDARYTKGAVVTHSGSGWVALNDNLGRPPGTTSDWRLFVKRGKDGRDGRDYTPPEAAA